MIRLDEVSVDSVLAARNALPGLYSRAHWVVRDLKSLKGAILKLPRSETQVELFGDRFPSEVCLYWEQFGVLLGRPVTEDQDLDCALVLLGDGEDLE